MANLIGLSWIESKTVKNMETHRSHDCVTHGDNWKWVFRNNARSEKAKRSFWFYSTVSHSTKRIRITNRQWIGSNPSYPNECSGKTIKEEKQTRVLFTARVFIWEIESFPINAVHSVQSSSRNAWISRPLVTTVLICQLSGQASAKLRPTTKTDMHLDSLKIPIEISLIIYAMKKER